MNALRLPLLGALLTVGLSGCFNFDAAYQTYCDAGRCAAGAGGGTGGGETGGGTAMGGGATGGGSTGGGTAMGGGAATGGGSAVDAGCQAFLCTEINWSGTESGPRIARAPGLNPQSLTRFNVYASFESAARFVNHFEYRFTGAPMPSVISRSNFPGNVDSAGLNGISLTDQWFTFTRGARHIVGSATPQIIGGCSAPDGGTNPDHFQAVPTSADEAWLVGYPMSICRWNSDGGLVQTAEDRSGKEYVYLTDVYVADSGNVYVSGGDYATGDGVCVIYRADGTPYDVPTLVDDFYTDGCLSIDGRGDEVYAVSRDDTMGRGHVLRHNFDAGFDIVHQSPFRLARLDVAPSGEVWVVGASNNVWYFDGGSWGEVALPAAETRFNITWNNVAAVDDGVIFTGIELQTDGGQNAVVQTYRRFGK